MIDFPHKILVPQRPHYLISRPRLNELLTIVTTQRLITVLGPAGYGKTSLLIDFASISPVPVCWYSFDSSDQDPWVFLDYLVASIEHQFPGSVQRTVALLSGGGRPSFGSIATNLSREMYNISCDFVLIFDDWHIVDAITDIKNIVMHLLLHCPRCHLILASRSYPSLPNMMLLTARRQMSSFNENQLRFTASEVAAVIEAGYQTSVTIEQATALADQSNGWITGILLSFQTISLAGIEPVIYNMPAERQIYRYLAEQVFDQQAADIQSFLLDSALIEDLTPEHCDTIFQRDDSRRLLEQLLRHHLFISEIKPGVLRYHSLFREFLQEHYRTVDPQRYRTMALQIAHFYARQGQWQLAFNCYIAAGDLAAARPMVAAGGEQIYLSGRLETLERWFAVLPEEELDARLLCLKARVQLDRGFIAEAQVLANLAETRARPDDELMVVLLQAQLARIDGRYEHALDLAQHALAHTADATQRATALRTIAICHHRLGELKSALDELQEAITIERQHGDLHVIAQLERDIGLCYRDIGRLDIAMVYYSQADAYWATTGNMGLRAMSLNSKGGLQHLTGHYLEAEATLGVALQCACSASVPHYQAAVLSNLGDLYCDLQLWPRASSAYAEARKVGGSAYLMSCLDLSDIRLVLRQRQYDAAARMLRQLPHVTRRYLPNEVLLLSGAIACGLHQYEQAAHVAQELIDILGRTRAPMDLARTYLLQAQIAATTAPNNSAALIELLEQAAQMADELGHDTFLVIEALHLRGVVRRAAAAGWARAENWLLRHQDMRLAAQMLNQEDQRPALVVRVLGVDQIILSGQPVKLGWHKAREVLYYLLAHPDGAPIDTLREVIWPNLEVERSGDTLRSAIYQLRSFLPRDLIVLRGRQMYQLNREVARIDYDVECFLHLLDTSADDPEALQEALDMYRGPYLAFTDSHWCLALRAQLEQRYLRALHLAAAHYEKLHLYADALVAYQRILTVDNLDEASHTGTMRCYVALGNRAAAINHYHELRRILDETLGLDPDPSYGAESLYRSLLAAS